MRRQSLAARAEVGPHARASAAKRLCTHLKSLRGRIIAGYLPIGSEADPLEAMRALSRENCICVPVVMAKGAPLRFRDWTPGCALEAGTFGVQVPVGGDWRVPDVVIVPLLAFDPEGGRLGYGGGFYDRTLTGLHDVRLLGYALEAQRVDAVPRGPTDVALPCIVTERGPTGPGLSPAGPAV